LQQIAIGQGQVVPIQTMTAYRGKAPVILNLGTK